jgi:hypothetical protein
MPLTETQWTDLARNLQVALERVAPEWTDVDMHDPGVAVLEALAYALAALGYRRSTLDERASLLARRVTDLARALATPEPDNSADDCEAGLQRVNFIQGMVLGVDDFQTAQDCARKRMNRRNRVLYGTGIASGLGVTVQHDTSGSCVVIAPGLALDPAGNEICLDQPMKCPLSTQGGVRFVLLLYKELLCRRVPSSATEPLDATNGAPTPQPTRIAETFKAYVAPAPDADALTIARLRHVRGRWRIDPTFKAKRVAM